MGGKESVPCAVVSCKEDLVGESLFKKRAALFITEKGSSVLKDVVV